MLDTSEQGSDMITFLYQRDHDRIATELARRFPAVRPLIAMRDGTLRFEGKCVEANHVRPDIVWITRHVFDENKAELFLDTALSEANVRWVQTFNAGLDTSFRKMKAYGIKFSARAWEAAEKMGLDTSIFQAMLLRGRRLCNSNAMAPAIAEYVMAQVSAEWYPIVAQRSAQAEHRWELTPFREMAKSRWMIFGYGSNGREIARRAQSMGARVTATRRTLTPDAHVDAVVNNAQGLEMLSEMDVVILTFPLSIETADFANNAFFKRMKTGSMLINISRGGLIDDAALLCALDRGAPRIAILDAFRKEPLPAEDPFWAHPAIRLTAHCSWAGDGVLERNDQLFIDNLENFIEGRPLMCEVDSSYF
ncbi:NAD(P)-dependent oxidoreductase [Sphingosinicella xenopeptidilytica]|uniref:NAD(P)-dependent oxidoreductase n=1 Tax=Sphingosinicella xenopeptidilytica TaxID=364098 RepID=A0ABW3C2C8_SPHXN